MTDELKHPEKDSSKSNIVIQREAEAAEAAKADADKGATP